MKFTVEKDGYMPTRATGLSAGYDLHAAYNVYVPAKDHVYVHTNVTVQMDKDSVGLVCSRSGLARKGLFVLNSPGVIDADFDGCIGVLLCNISNLDIAISKGDRVAQLIEIKFVKPDDGVETVRGTGGFGSTGA